jgi:hypothetical protein
MFIIKLITNVAMYARPYLGGGALSTNAPGASFLGVPKFCGRKFAHLRIIELLKLF